VKATPPTYTAGNDPAALTSQIEVVWEAAFEALPEAALVLDGDGRLLAANAAARGLLGRRAAAGATCCSLLGCREGACASVLARAGERRQLQVHLDDGAVAWASPVATAAGQVVVALHRAAGPAGRAREDLPERLGIRALGRTRIEGRGGEEAGEWLSHRPGQLLKYLVCERGRVVTLEELLEVFWPNAGRAGATSVRQAIHTLRDRLEPDRPKGKPSGYVVARTGGYELTPGRVWIDADDFEAHARAGLEALQQGAAARADASLTAAATAYGGDFLADEPYAEWVLTERERLRDLAGQVLRGLSALKHAAGDDEAAGEYLQRLAELEPLDLDAQRQLLTLLLRRGRRSEAARRYEVVCRRFRRAFGEEPGFELAELARPSAPRFAAAAARRR